MPRRSYAHYCAIARSLDVLGERWTLLIIRELLPGPRRYTELHADLPGISTDVLAARLKEMEADGLLERRRVAPPTPAWVYDLTPRGRDLLPVLGALARWGGDLLDEGQPTDALRSHWLTLPLAHLLGQAISDHHGVIELRVGGACCYLRFGADGVTPAYDKPGEPDAVLMLSTETAVSLTNKQITIAEALSAGHLDIEGESALARALSAGSGRHVPQPETSRTAPAITTGTHH
jgi:DNA-binding HxlR family transcriptional regulator